MNIKICKNSLALSRLFICLICIYALCMLGGCSTYPSMLHNVKTDNTTTDMYIEATALNVNTNNSRLVNFLNKAANKEPVTIAFFGGSITEGYVATEPSLMYARQVFSYFEKTFPKTDFTYVNAGIAGTGSGIGVHRVHEDLLKYNPDLVIIDAAVNDNNTVYYQETYENLVRQILNFDSNPAVMLLFMVEENGNCATGVESEIGTAYQLPMIDYGAAVRLAMDQGLFTWEDIAGDYVHPNDKGHAIIAELITTYINNLYNSVSGFWGKIPQDTLDKYSLADISYNDIDYITKENYINGRILDFSQITPTSYGEFVPYKDNEVFSNGLTSTKASTDEYLEFEVEAANIGLLLQSPELEEAGYFDILIDDEPYSLISYQGFLVSDAAVYSSDTTAKHNVKIRRSADYPDAKLTILGVLISK